MGILSKVWGRGTLGITASPVLTVSGESAVGAQLRLRSSHDDWVSVEVSYNTDGTDVDMTPVRIPARGFAEIDLSDLEAGDIVSARADVDAVIKYLSTGGSQ